MATFICSVCSKEKDIDAKEEHHITPTKTVVLCRSCHRKLHAKMRKNKATANSLPKKFRERIPEWEYLKKSGRIIRLRQEFPLISCDAIAKLTETTVTNVWKTLSVARKKHILT
jgi:DNA-directed RNA polymerase subunit RPC12/RpoP